MRVLLFKKTSSWQAEKQRAKTEQIYEYEYILIRIATGERVNVLACTLFISLTSPVAFHLLLSIPIGGSLSMMGSIYLFHLQQYS